MRGRVLVIINSGLADSVFMITGLAHETGAVAMQF